ncbi:LPS biosynthesis-modulating metalloenzyme YejM [Proteus hauseri]|nr:LPS biosynthesis-modulating metalloenzyme YejM [Proteus hauseri]
MVTRHQSYREKVSQMISWGHWFALFNIILSLLLGSRYLFISDWPGTFAGRLYAIISWMGHFSFIVFAIYILILFPLTFVVVSQRLLRVVSCALASAGLTILLFDIAVYQQFQLHLTQLVWDLVINPNEGEMAREWQLIFIAIPIIFLVEMLFATWSWQKLRSLNRQRWGKPLAGVFISCFILSHSMSIWADANFYRPITMQRANLPLSYPMTARKFLERHGFINQSEYEQRLISEGNPTAQSITYPLAPLVYYKDAYSYNLLIVVIDGLGNEEAAQLPSLQQFANNNLSFSRHYSSGIDNDTALFGLFYGISPSYLDSVLSSRKNSALFDALNYRNYQLALFSTNGFQTPLFKQAVLSDFSIPSTPSDNNDATISNWRNWLIKENKTSPWFSFLQINGYTNKTTQQAQLNSQLESIFTTLQENNVLDNTVVVVTSNYHQDDDKKQHNQWLSNKDTFNLAQSQVPLIVHWPDMTPQQIDKMTSHQDIMTTLMKHVLHVISPAENYSQGEDLFASSRHHPWIFTGDDETFVVFLQDNTLLIDKNGRYALFDKSGKEIASEKPDLGLLLQVLAEQKRFIER